MRIKEVAEKDGKKGSFYILKDDSKPEDKEDFITITKAGEW
jgi:hypothetical protein